MHLRSSSREVGLCFPLRQYNVSMTNTINQGCQYYVGQAFLFLELDLVKLLKEVSVDTPCFYSAKERCLDFLCIHTHQELLSECRSKLIEFLDRAWGEVVIPNACPFLESHGKGTKQYFVYYSLQVHGGPIVCNIIKRINTAVALPA